MDVAGRFGDNLVARAGSQDELSVRASVHRTEISQLERGLRLARVDTIVKLCGGLEADPAELLAGISWEPGENRIGHFKKPKSNNPQTHSPTHYEPSGFVPGPHLSPCDGRQ
jgi:transcriptional regulator with XRE-family HTH domain